MKKVTIITALILISATLFAQSKPQQTTPVKPATVTPKMEGIPAVMPNPKDTVYYSLTTDSNTWAYILDLIRHSSLLKASQTDDLIDLITKKFIRVTPPKQP